MNPDFLHSLSRHPDLLSLSLPQLWQSSSCESQRLDGRGTEPIRLSQNVTCVHIGLAERWNVLRVLYKQWRRAVASFRCGS